jgi:hypothetical protein
VQGKSAFVERVQRLLQVSGFGSARLLSFEGIEEGESAIFEVDGLVLRAIRDRSQEFLDVGTTGRPGELHQFDDLAIAMGWSTVERVLKRTEPEPLSSVIKQVQEHWDAIQQQLTGSTAEFTRAQVNRATAARTAAVEKKLR